MTIHLVHVVAAVAIGSVFFGSLSLGLVLLLDELVEEAGLAGSVATCECDVLVPRIGYCRVESGDVGPVIMLDVLRGKRSQFDVRRSVSASAGVLQILGLCHSLVMVAMTSDVSFLNERVPEFWILSGHVSGNQEAHPSTSVDRPGCCSQGGDGHRCNRAVRILGQRKRGIDPATAALT